MNKKIFSIVGLFVLLAVLTAFQQKTRIENVQAKKGMIKVTILYPNGEGKKFDMDYYASKHMPLVASLLGDSLKMFEIDKGIGGRAPGDPIPNLAIGYLYFDRLSAFQSSFAPHAQQIRADVANFTNIAPVVQISEVIK